MENMRTNITSVLSRLRPRSSSTSTYDSTTAEKSAKPLTPGFKMRQLSFVSLIPTTLSLVAFILSLLCLTAGRTPDYLPNLFLLRVNTTSIATQTDLPTLLASVGISNTTSTGIPRLDSAINSLNSSDLGSLLNTAAHELGLHDFYTAHAMTWCEGALLSTGEHTTGCTSPAMPFSFDPIRIIEGELLHNITLESIGFPTGDVGKVVDALEVAYRVMSICYLIGVIFAAVGILGGLFAVWKPIRGLAVANGSIATATLICLGAASAVATIIATRVREVVNDKAKVINVYAENSTAFLALSWVSVACIISVCLWWWAGCCCGRGVGRGRSVDREAGVEKWGQREAEERNRRRETEEFVGQRTGAGVGFGAATAYTGHQPAPVMPYAQQREPLMTDRENYNVPPQGQQERPEDLDPYMLPPTDAVHIHGHGRSMSEHDEFATPYGESPVHSYVDTIGPGPYADPHGPASPTSTFQTPYNASSSPTSTYVAPPYITSTSPPISPYAPAVAAVAHGPPLSYRNPHDEPPSPTSQYSRPTRRDSSEYAPTLVGSPTSYSAPSSYRDGGQSPPRVPVGGGALGRGGSVASSVNGGRYQPPRGFNARDL